MVPRLDWPQATGMHRALPRGVDMRKAIVLALFGLVIPTALSSQTTTLEIVGTGDGLEILRALARQYSKANSTIQVEIPPSIGSGGGIAAVGAGRAELGRVARELSNAEREAGVVYVPIARMPSVFIVHPTAKVKSVTPAQLVDIYAGRVTNWKDVGGADLRIRVIRREDIDSTLTVLRQTMPGWKDLAITERSKMATSTQEAIDSTRSVPGAIGFAPYSRTLENGLSVLQIGGVHPLSSAYPSNNVLALIYLAGSVSPVAADFVKYSLGNEARQIISDHGGVPTSDGAAKLQSGQGSLN